MGLIHNDWYDTNAQQRYPLSDSAIGTDDDGISQLADDILVDARLVFPITAGEFAFVGGITLSSNLLTIVFLAASSPTAASGFTPLAVLTISRPITPYRHYTVSAIYPGAGGWVVFGSQVNTADRTFVGRYSTPRQSLLLPRCASTYHQLPVQSISKLSKATTLAGLVKIKAGNDIAITRENVEINATLRDSLVFRLVQEHANQSVLSTYISTCDVRPESNNCNKPGIQYINTVTPSCAGNIDIEFDAAAFATAKFEDCGPGIVVDYATGLAQICAPRVQHHYHDLCGSDSSLIFTSISLTSIGSTGGPGTSQDIGLSPCSNLPYYDDFAIDAYHFVIKKGAFDFLDPNADAGASTGSSSAGTGLPPTWTATGGSTPNVSLFDDCGYLSTLNKRASTSVLIRGTYPHRNGGLVVDYRVEQLPASRSSSAPFVLLPPQLRIVYFLVLIDFNYSCLRVMRFSGTGFVEEYRSPVLPMIFENYVQLVVDVIPQSSTQTVLHINVLDPLISGTPIFTVSLETTKLKGDGKFGVGSIESFVHFGYFSLANL